MNSFVSGDHSIKNLMTRDKAFLRRGNNFIQKRLKSQDNHFSAQLIDGIAQANGSKIREMSRLRIFRDKDNKSIINLL